MLEAGGLDGQQVLLAPPTAAEHQLHQGQQYVAQHRLKPGLAIKNPPKKPTQKKFKNPKNHLKYPLKMCFFGGGFFKIFIFFIKIVQTFLFETDFL